MHTQVIEIEMILASGEVVVCSPDVNPNLFKACQVSLGDKKN